MSFESIAWLIKTGIKAIGLENVRHSPPGTPFGKDDGDGLLLLAGIPYPDSSLN